MALDAIDDLLILRFSTQHYDPINNKIIFYLDEILIINKKYNI